MAQLFPAGRAGLFRGSVGPGCVATDVRRTFCALGLQCVGGGTGWHSLVGGCCSWSVKWLVFSVSGQSTFAGIMSLVLDSLDGMGSPTYLFGENHKQDRQDSHPARRPRYWLLWMSLQFTPWPPGCWSWAASGSSAPPMPCCWLSTAGAPPCWEATRVASNPKRSLPCKLWRLNWRKCWVLTSSLKKIGLGHIRLFESRVVPMWAFFRHDIIPMLRRGMETSQWALSENVPRLRTLLLRVGSHHRAAHPISVVWHESQVVQGQGAIDLPTTNCRETHGSFRLGESLPLMWERWQANVGIRAYDNTCCRLMQHGSVAVVVLKTFGSKSGCFFHRWLLGHRLIHGKYMSLGEIGSWGKSPCIGQVECGNVGVDLFRLHFARWAVIKILGD